MLNAFAAFRACFAKSARLISGFLSQGNVSEGAKREAAAQAEKSRLEGYLEAACQREEGLNADLTQAHAHVTQLTMDVKRLNSEVRQLFGRGAWLWSQRMGRGEVPVRAPQPPTGYLVVVSYGWKYCVPSLSASTEEELLSSAMIRRGLLKLVEGGHTYFLC